MVAPAKASGIVTTATTYSEGSSTKVVTGRSPSSSRTKPARRDSRCSTSWL